jgi:hypothetical protein
MGFLDASGPKMNAFLSSRRNLAATGAVFSLLLIFLIAYQQAPSSSYSRSRPIQEHAVQENNLLSHIGNRTLGVSSRRQQNRFSTC